MRRWRSRPWANNVAANLGLMAAASRTRRDDGDVDMGLVASCQRQSLRDAPTSICAVHLVLAGWWLVGSKGAIFFFHHVPPPRVKGHQYFVRSRVNTGAATLFPPSRFPFPPRQLASILGPWSSSLSSHTWTLDLLWRRAASLLACSSVRLYLLGAWRLFPWPCLSVLSLPACLHR